MRGLPGSGKSTRALKLFEAAKDKNESVMIVSADDYFTKPDGSYEFKANRLGEAHAKCLRDFIDALYAGFELVIVDNTNIRLEEFETYLQVATLAGAKIEIDGCKPKDTAELEMWHKRCVHGVPLESMKRRAGQWQDIPLGWRVTYV